MNLHQYIYIYICIICNIIDGSLSMIHGYIIDAWWIFKLELYPPQFCDDPWPCWALMTSLFSHLDSRDWGYKKTGFLLNPRNWHQYDPSLITIKLANHRAFRSGWSGFRQEDPRSTAMMRLKIPITTKRKRTSPWEVGDQPIGAPEKLWKQRLHQHVIIVSIVFLGIPDNKGRHDLNEPLV